MAKTKAEPNVVPLCDVLLVLLIIFMVITPVVQKGIDIKLPEVSQESQSMPVGLVVLTIEDESTVNINQRQFTMDMLGDELKTIYATRHDKTIFIRSNARLPFSILVDVMDIAKGAGVENLAIIPEYIEED